MAHQLGCSHLPEITRYVLQGFPVQIVIASDGVWEKLEPRDVAILAIKESAQETAEKVT